MLLYLAGPMTGYPDFNFPAFHAAARHLRSQGFDVINPAETAGGATHLDRETYMAIDLGYVGAADGIAVLPGWQNSPGAQLEVLTAINRGKPVYEYQPFVGLSGLIRVTSCQVAFTVEDL